MHVEEMKVSPLGRLWLCAGRDLKFCVDRTEDRLSLSIDCVRKGKVVLLSYLESSLWLDKYSLPADDNCASFAHLWVEEYAWGFRIRYEEESCLLARS